MKRRDMKALILRVGGTNCDRETAVSFRDLGVGQVDVLHTKRVARERSLLDYHVLVFPGGFAYGDYVRSGVIWAKDVEVNLLDDLTRFINEDRMVLGICNGFQVLVELGLLPGFKGRSDFPEAVLAPNTSNSYECRWVYVKKISKANCLFTKLVPQGEVLRFPVAHGEGRFLFPKEKEAEYLETLYENDQLVLRFVKPDGSPANGEYPYNPNGAFHDIAGICSPEGNVFGLMPHPERAFFGWQLPDWTRDEQPQQYGHGKAIFESIIRSVEQRF